MKFLRRNEEIWHPLDVRAIEYDLNSIKVSVEVGPDSRNISLVIGSIVALQVRREGNTVLEFSLAEGISGSGLYDVQDGGFRKYLASGSPSDLSDALHTCILGVDVVIDAIHYDFDYASRIRSNS